MQTVEEWYNNRGEHGVNNGSFLINNGPLLDFRICIAIAHQTNVGPRLDCGGSLLNTGIQQWPGFIIVD